MKIEQKVSDTDFKLKLQQSMAKGKWKTGSKIMLLFLSFIRIPRSGMLQVHDSMNQQGRKLLLLHKISVVSKIH